MKTTISLFVAVLFATVSFAQQPAVVAPDIHLKNTTGAVTKLSSLKGKVVLIDFWASWCGPCRESIPSLKKLYSKYKDKGFEIYGISLDRNDKDWKRALNAFKMDWTQVWDNEGAVAMKWNVNYIPSSFLIDKSGRIVAVNADDKQLDKLIEKMIN
jgi:thiol-disulfide isomerase/thioredoxin